MTSKSHDTELIAAYHAGRLSADEAAAFDARLASDSEFAAEVELLAPVSSWLKRSFEASPSANYRLSPDRIAALRAAARGDIVAFPQRTQAPARRRSVFSRVVRRYGLAAAAAVAMIIGGVSGFESGRFQFSDTSRPLIVAVDLTGSEGDASESDMIHYYPPAYGLDHADFAAIASRYSGTGHPAQGSFAYAARPHVDYGLPGPGSPYLRSGELLFER